MRICIFILGLTCGLDWISMQAKLSTSSYPRLFYFMGLKQHFSLPRAPSTATSQKILVLQITACLSVIKIVDHRKQSWLSDPIL